ncbi:MAG: hypothetical protein WC455_11605 [Dehalococcoidia bacterium]
MTTIYKYPIPFKDWFRLQLPADAEILSVQVQRGIPCIWALVRVGNPLTIRHFRMVGTGYPITDGDLHYIGTVQVADETLVFHLFEDLTQHPNGETDERS